MTTTTRHPNILDWDDGRRFGDPIMVTLVKGRAFYDNDVDDVACHTRGFATVKAALAGAKAAQPCRCSRCVDTGHIA